MKRDPFAGGNESYQNLQAGGLRMLALDSTNIRGHFAVTAATRNTLEVSGSSTRYPGIGVRVFVRGYNVDSSYVRFDGSIAVP